MLCDAVETAFHHLWILSTYIPLLSAFHSKFSFIIAYHHPPQIPHFNHWSFLLSTTCAPPPFAFHSTSFSIVAFHHLKFLILFTAHRSCDLLSSVLFSRCTAREPRCGSYKGSRYGSKRAGWNLFGGGMGPASWKSLQNQRSSSEHTNMLVNKNVYYTTVLVIIISSFKRPCSSKINQGYGQLLPNSMR